MAIITKETAPAFLARARQAREHRASLRSQAQTMAESLLASNPTQGAWSSRLEHQAALLAARIEREIAGGTAPLRLREFLAAQSELIAQWCKVQKQLEPEFAQVKDTARMYTRVKPLADMAQTDPQAVVDSLAKVARDANLPLPRPQAEPEQGPPPNMVGPEPGQPEPVPDL